MRTSFKTFLSEKAMNMAVYKGTFKRLEDDAKIGFEFEMKIPANKVSSKVETDTLRRYDITDMTKLEDYFDIDRNTRRQIDNAYNSWLEQQKEIWVDNNYAQFEDETTENAAERESDARSVAAAEFDDETDYDFGDYTLRIWYDQTFNNMRAFLDEFGVEPQFGWEDDSRSEFRMDEYSIGDALGYAADIFTKEITRTEVGDPARGAYKTWGVVNDASIAPNDDDYYGVELVTSPMKPSLALAQLESVFDVMHEYGFETDSTCGLHVSISVPDMKNKLDPLKLMLFMGENYILDVFERRGNEFAQPLYYNALAKVQQDGGIKSLPKNFIKQLEHSLLHSQKYKTANIGKLISNGYVEFRAAGGADYESRLKDVTSAIGRFLTIVELAIDPEAERQEYMKKVGKLMNALRKNLEQSDYEISTYRTGPKEVMAPLKRLMVSKDIRELSSAKAARISDALNGVMQPRVQDMYSLIKYAYMGAQAIGVKPDVKEIVHLKKLTKQMGISQQGLRDHFNDVKKVDAENIDNWDEIEPMIKKDFKI